MIDAFNHDKPYDRFIREQLAGDEIDPGSAEALIATGFYRLGIWDDEPADRPLARYDGLDGIVSTTGQVFLGMTINCARCHDHKVDPIPQRDYYRLLAFFHDVTDPGRQEPARRSAEPGRRDRRHVRRGARPGRDARPAPRQSQPARATRSSRACRRSWARLAPTFANGPGKRRALADWLTDRAQPADGPRDGQPALAVPLRPRHRADAQRLRQARRAADPSRAARLAGRRAHGRRLAAQADAPADHALERLPDVVAGDAGRAGRRPGQPLVLAVPDAPAHGRGGPRLDPGGQRRRST